jgi:hypothetical protein
MKQFVLLLILCLPVMSNADSRQMMTEVIPLGYRSINEIIPVIRPLVAPTGSVTGLHGQLVVTATPSAMAKVRDVLAALDKSPARLLISVSRGDNETAASDSASIQGQVGNLSINNDGVRAGSTAAGHQDVNRDYLAVQAKNNMRSETMNITQQVQVLEGREAYISAGQELPVRNRGAVTGPGGIYRYDSTEFYPAVTGFYAIPRLRGDEVVLEINSLSRRHDNIKMGVNGRSIQRGRQPARVSNLSTSVTGRLGEWIMLGNIDGSTVNKQSGIGAASQQLKNSTSQIFLKVEKIQNGN